MKRLISTMLIIASFGLVAACSVSPTCPEDTCVIPMNNYLRARAELESKQSKRLFARSGPPVVSLSHGFSQKLKGNPVFSLGHEMRLVHLVFSK